MGFEPRLQLTPQRNRDHFAPPRTNFHIGAKWCSGVVLKLRQPCNVTVVIQEVVQQQRMGVTEEEREAEERTHPVEVTHGTHERVIGCALPAVTATTLGVTPATFVVSPGRQVASVVVLTEEAEREQEEDPSAQHHHTIEERHMREDLLRHQERGIGVVEEEVEVILRTGCALPATTPTLLDERLVIGVALPVLVDLVVEEEEKEQEQEEEEDSQRQPMGEEVELDQHQA
ncbi:hypothetical protein QOT17_014185 [Balamuthia mandrillaris]